MNTHVDFKTAKLLKEKDFDRPCDWGFDFRGSNLQNFGRHIDSHLIYHAPTIAEVVMWLYEKHGIWIWVERCYDMFRPYAEEISDKKFGKWKGHKYKTLTEAYKKAILYCLTKLI